MEDAAFDANGNNGTDWKQFEARMVALKGFFPHGERDFNDKVRLTAGHSTKSDGIRFDTDGDDGCLDHKYCTDPMAYNEGSNYYWCDTDQLSNDDDRCVYAHNRGDMLRGSLANMLKISSSFRVLDVDWNHHSFDSDDNLYVAIGFSDAEEKQDDPNTTENEDSALVRAMKRLADPNDTCTYVLKTMKKMTDSSGDTPSNGDTEDELEVAIIDYENSEFVDGSNGNTPNTESEGEVHDKDQNNRVDRRELLPELNCMLDAPTSPKPAESESNYVEF